MAYKAKLLAVEDNPVPNDSVSIKIEYSDATTGKTITETYKLSAGHFPTLQSVRDFIAGEVSKLNTFENIAAQLRSRVNQDL